MAAEDEMAAHCFSKRLEPRLLLVGEGFCRQTSTASSPSNQIY